MGDFVRINNRLQRRPVSGRTYADEMLIAGANSIKNPAGTQAANHANSTAPSSASLSNTAAGYTTLGGRFQFAAVAGAATDYALFSYQVPAGYRLTVEEIAINIMNTVVAVATTASVFDWFAAIGDAVSLADASQRRIPLGLQGFAVAAAVGAVAPEILRNFRKPLVIPSQKFFCVGFGSPIGTNTATEIFRGDVFINGMIESESAS